MAKQYSIDPTTKNKGGVLPNVAKGQQDAALSNAAFSAAANKVLGPIKGQFGYYVLEVTKITPAKTRSLAQSTALIHQTLLSQLQTAAQTAVNDAAKKRWFSKTTCRSMYAMADCPGYKAPKTPATAATGAAGAAGAAGSTVLRAAPGLRQRTDLRPRSGLRPLPFGGRPVDRRCGVHRAPGRDHPPPAPRVPVGP